MSELASGIRQALAMMNGPKYVKCRELGISIPTYDNWVNGVAEPSDANLARLANKANVTQSWIRSGGRSDDEAIIED